MSLVPSKLDKHPFFDKKRDLDAAQRKIAEDCDRGIQNCQHCKAYDCGDNTNPRGRAF